MAPSETLDALRSKQLSIAERAVLIFTLCTVVALGTWQIATSATVSKLRVVACGQRLDGLSDKQIDKLHSLCGPPKLTTTIISTPATPGEAVAGSKGKAGIAGTRGHSGRNGRTGRPGHNGTNGRAGRPGRNGSRGSTGAQGPQGPRGAKGDRGERGRQGVAGSDGVSPSTQALVQQAVEQVLARVCARVPQVCQ